MAHLLKSACVFSKPFKLLLLLLITINISRSTNMFSCLSEKYQLKTGIDRCEDMVLAMCENKNIPQQDFLAGVMYD